MNDEMRRRYEHRSEAQMAKTRERVHDEDEAMRRKAEGISDKDIARARKREHDKFESMRHRKVTRRRKGKRKSHVRT